MLRSRLGKRLASVSRIDLRRKEPGVLNDPVELKLWDVETGHVVSTLKGHTGGVLGLAFSPDGKRLASASDDQTVRVWEVETGQELLVLKGHTGWVRAVAFSPDGKRLASASQDGTVRLWDADRGPEASAGP